MRQFLVVASLGLGLALTGCDDGTPRRGEPYKAPSATEQAREVFGETDPAELPANQRAALVYARAVTALALARAGEVEAAQTQAGMIGIGADAEPGLMVGLDTLGFDPAPLEAALAAPQDETVAEAADTMLDALRQSATGDVKATTEFLMKSLAGAYEVSVSSGEIADLAGYQGAYGLAVTARDIVAAQNSETYDDLRLELEMLVRMWPGKGPLAASTPAPEAEMALVLSNVKLALASLP